jgi:hypothetical protein
MQELISGYLGKYTIISLLLVLIAYIIDRLPFILKNNITLDSFKNDWNFFIISILILIIYIIFYSIMILRYESILRFFFRRPMLEYTLAKKKFKNGIYDVHTDPRKNYDILPQEIKTEIDKLDIILRTEKIPVFLDLFIASFNSFLILLYGVTFKNRVFLIIGILTILIFGSFFVISFLNLKNTINFDYKSLFEE